jgi:hypothetical protein
MGRSLALAIAVTLCVLGLECLLIKRATLTIRQPPSPPPATASYEYFLDPALTGAPAEGAKRVIEPPEWAPFGLLSSGVVLLLYSKSLGKSG